MTRTDAFLSQLSQGQVFLADGATGTMLQSMGLEPGRAPEAWLLEHPDKVRALHQMYLDAGSDLLLTNTFGGTRFRLKREGLQDRVTEIGRRAAELAREVAANRAYVVGDMGPTGQLLAPLGAVTAEEVSQAFAEQAKGLAEGGADFLLVETMSDLGEARAALEGARRVTNLPIFCTFSFDTRGRTMMGVRPKQVALEFGRLVTGVGANCGRDPAEYPGFLEEMAQAAPGAFLWAKPNAGLPRLGDDGLVVYDTEPELLAALTPQLIAAGARIVGGCCGTSPRHIAAMAEALRSLAPGAPERTTQAP
ncbi:MAG TPA: homocysteine S-methyltransferase family protein [Anaerolineae bacterium]|nr:homocysteine S-methyltransferase family protein [Anaerolineae bacterium]